MVYLILHNFPEFITIYWNLLEFLKLKSIFRKFPRILCYFWHTPDTSAIFRIFQNFPAFKTNWLYKLIALFCPNMIIGPTLNHPPRTDLMARKSLFPQLWHQWPKGMVCWWESPKQWAQPTHRSETMVCMLSQDPTFIKATILQSNTLISGFDLKNKKSRPVYKPNICKNWAATAEACTLKWGQK